MQHLNMYNYYFILLSYRFANCSKHSIRDLTSPRPKSISGRVTIDKPW